MAEGVRVYRKKVWFWGDAKRELLALAEDMGVEPGEVLRIAIATAHQDMLAERQKTVGPDR